jgi:long-chain acyl-CoA synthetase
MTADAYQSRPWVMLYPERLKAHSNFHDTNMLAVFRETARRYAGQDALRYFDRTISYSELDALSDRFANWLIEQGVNAADRVAIILQNMPQFVIAALGAWKIGAIPVPSNPMYRDRELQNIFSDSSPKVIVCLCEHLSTVIQAVDAAKIAAVLVTTTGLSYQSRGDSRVLPTQIERAGSAVDFMCALAVASEDKPPAVDLRPGDLGLLLYTSGTTGVPKGAMLTHRNLVFSTLTTQRWFDLDERLRVLAIAPLFHVTGFVAHFCLAALTGGVLILSYRFNAAVLLGAMLEHRPTFSCGAITAYIALMNTPAATREHFSSVAYLGTGGAPIPPAVVEAFFRQFGVYLQSGYGMTELTCQSHLTPCGIEAPIDAESGALSVGVPIPGTDVRVVDESGSPLPVGLPGELHVRGPHTMAGYWNKRIDTGEALSDGWMHTGDIGLMDAKGWFYIVDRKKDMISASGFKVWPREIEDVLYSHPSVREAAVVGVPDSYRGETVKAFVSVKPGVSLTVEELQSLCRQRLAAYKVPRFLEIVADLPKTVSGKIMRSELRREV